MISEVFWTSDKLWAFQYVDGAFNVYNADGDFVIELASFEDVLRFIN